MPFTYISDPKKYEKNHTFFVLHSIYKTAIVISNFLVYSTLPKYPEACRSVAEIPQAACGELHLIIRGLILITDDMEFTGVTLFRT